MSSQAIWSEHTFLKKPVNNKNTMLLWNETHESDGSKRVESGRIHGKVKVFIFAFSKSHLQMIWISKKTRTF